MNMNAESPSAKPELGSPVPDVIRRALEFQESQWATGSIYEDSFYVVPEGTADSVPGTLLKVENHVDTSKYTLPPATAIARIMYQSITLNGSLVPVSAFVLWPYLPRRLIDGYPIVAWSHGTSGLTPNCAPSHMKNLWHHFQAPYQLVLQGYVVVATDYAGLGVDKDAKGNRVVHEYLASSSQANDVLYSVQAAQTAFPELSKNFVVIGHSQGGGSAWAAAQRQAITPVQGYLGAVALAPVTSIHEESDLCRNILGFNMLPGISYAFPEFNPETVLTPEGKQQLDLILQTGLWSIFSLTLLERIPLLKPTWIQNPTIQHYLHLATNGGRKTAGPLLVIHGEQDPILKHRVAATTVAKTRSRFPASEIEFVCVPGVTHVPTVTSSQPLWMDWIADRFAGLVVPRDDGQSGVRPARPIASYQPEMNWFIESATQPYHTP